MYGSPPPVLCSLALQSKWHLFWIDVIFFFFFPCCFVKGKCFPFFSWGATIPAEGCAGQPKAEEKEGNPKLITDYRSALSFSVCLSNGLIVTAGRCRQSGVSFWRQSASIVFERVLIPANIERVLIPANILPLLCRWDASWTPKRKNTSLSGKSQEPAVAFCQKKL